MPVSRFIKEIPDKLLLDENKIESEKQGKKDYSAGKKARKEVKLYSKGDLIEHKMWGRGKVIKVKKLKDDCELDVIFDSRGLKHLLVSFAPIKKI